MSGGQRVAGRPTSAAQRRAQVAAVFDQVADSYDQAGVPWFGPIARRLVQQLAPAPGERAVDLGCGRGAALFPLAEAVGPTGTVTGVDLAPRMIAATRKEVRARRLTQVDLHVMDAAVPRLAESGYDVVAASFVLFFLPAPVAALRAWRRLLVPGGRLGISTFAEHQAGWLEDVFRPYLPAPAFGAATPFGSDDRVKLLLESAGFTAVRTAGFDLSVTFADVDQWHAWSWSHGQRAVWEQIPPADRDRVRDAAAQRLAAGRDGDGQIRLVHRIRLTTGRRP
jgi:ubiquinone/menaquinone biosynthesis C-methylase UbiE